MRGHLGEPWLLTLGLAAARVVPLAWLVPAFGGPRPPAFVRLGLGLVLTVLALPALLPAVTAMPLAGAGAEAGALHWLLLGGRELLVGVTVGFAASVFFRAAEAAGHLADAVRGARGADALGTDGQEGGGALGDLYLFVSVLVFLELGGLRLFAAALARSYEAVPLMRPLGAGGAGAELRGAAALVTAAAAKLTESAVGLAAPVLVAMLLAEAALGMLGRAAPQLPLHFVAMPARALLGLGIVLLGLGALAATLAAGIPAWHALVERAFAAWLPR